MCGAYPATHGPSIAGTPARLQLIIKGGANAKWAGTWQAQRDVVPATPPRGACICLCIPQCRVDNVVVSCCRPDALGRRARRRAHPSCAIRARPPGAATAPTHRPRRQRPVGARSPPSRRGCPCGEREVAWRSPLHALAARSDTSEHKVHSFFDSILLILCAV